MQRFQSFLPALFALGILCLAPAQPAKAGIPCKGILYAESDNGCAHFQCYLIESGPDGCVYGNCSTWFTC